MTATSARTSRRTRSAPEAPGRSGPDATGARETPGSGPQPGPQQTGGMPPKEASRLVRREAGPYLAAEPPFLVRLQSNTDSQNRANPPDTASSNRFTSTILG